MPAERPVRKFHPTRPGRLLPLPQRMGAVAYEARQTAMREASLEYRRKEAAAIVFKDGSHRTVRSFDAVMNYVRLVIPDFDDRFPEKYNPIFEEWHGIRVAMLDVPLDDPDYMKISRQKTDAFDQKFFTDPETGTFQEDKYEKVKPAIAEITNVVRR